jgi:hypothetical protein
MSEEMFTKHQDTKANCWRCRHEGDYSLEYYAKTTENGEYIVKGMVAAAPKRNPDDDHNASPATDKRPKIAPK